jgi:hypothetical protein
MRASNRGCGNVAGPEMTRPSSSANVEPCSDGHVQQILDRTTGIGENLFDDRLDALGGQSPTGA